MMRFLRKHMQLIFMITIVGFFGGAFVGFGGYFFSGASNADTAAIVNGTKIPLRQYNNLYTRAMENLQKGKTEVNEAAIEHLKQEVIQDLIQEEVFWNEAKKYGITVSDQELASDLQNFTAFQREGRFDRNAYFQIIYQVLHTTTDEFENSRRRQIAISKLRNLVASSIQMSEPEIMQAYKEQHPDALKDFEKEKAKFSQTLRQQKVMMVFNEWFKQINQTIKVKVFINQKEKAS